MISKESIQELINNTSIVNIIGNYINLKKSGNNFIGICPFHSEKHPSFAVNYRKNFYYCFGCGTTGTVINFLMKYLGLTFLEAINKLLKTKQEEPGLNEYYNKNINITSNNIKSNIQSKLNKNTNFVLFNIMQKVSKFYQYQLQYNSEAIQYLKKRGIKENIISKFCIGYSPKGWKNLNKIFLKYKNNELFEAGLIFLYKKENKLNEKIYFSIFRDRIMFPIKDINGKIIGFGGRSINNNYPKYLNSPETSIFSKSYEIYGIYEAQINIKKEQYVIIVEGYLDVITLYQFGFKNTVAILGTICTETHIKKLFLQTNLLIFSFDGDKAGEQAANRTLFMCLHYIKNNQIIKFLFLPSNSDPDNYIRKFGIESFKKKIDNSISLTKFLLNKILYNKNSSNINYKIKILYESKKILCSLPISTLRSQIIKDISEITGLTLMEISIFYNIKKESLNKLPIIKKYYIVTEISKFILRNFIIYPSILSKFDENTMNILHSLKNYGELFKELFICIKLLGSSLSVHKLYIILCNGINGEIFKNIFLEILNYDGNIIKLLNKNLKDKKYFDKYYSQEKLAIEEIKIAIKKIHYYNLCKNISKLSKQKNHSKQELLELTNLNQQRINLKDKHKF